MSRIALKPRNFPWFDYSRYTFSLGLQAGSRTLLSGHSASEYDPPSGEIVVKGGMAEQARTAWAKIATILEAGGKTFAEVVRVAEYVTTDGIERYAEAREIREEVLGAAHPAVNVVVVKRLLRPQAFIEIEVEAGAAAAAASASLRAWSGCATDGLVYLSSILPLDDAGAVVRAGDVVGQARAIYIRATRVLKEFGLDMSHVVKTVDYLTTAALPAYKDTGRVRRENFAPDFPAATGIIMPRVSHRDSMLQVDFIASRHGRTVVNPGLGRYAQLTYSPAARAGNMLFVSGMAALDPSSGIPVHAGDVVAQSTFVYENILRVVAAAGGGPEHLVKTVEYVTPTALPRYREVGGVRTRMLREPFPVSTGVVCEALLRPEFQIEVDSVATLD
ncbi:MAG: RidA family protein [Candidatus Binataceae bacterium]